MGESGGSGSGSPSILGAAAHRKSLLPKRLEERDGAAAVTTAAMDLSTTKEDGDGGEGHPAAAMAATGISLVKPEVLFGRKEAEENADDGDDEKARAPRPAAPSLPFSPFLASGLAAAVAAMASGGNTASPVTAAPPSLGSNEMRNAFQEVLKLYGVPAEVAAAIAKNAQNAQGESEAIPSY